METIQVENTTPQDLLKLQRVIAERSAQAHVSATDGLLFFNHRIYVSRVCSVRSGILSRMTLRQRDFRTRNVHSRASQLLSVGQECGLIFAVMSRPTLYAMIEIHHR